MNGANNSFCADSNLPLVMDLYPNFPIRQQFSPYYQSHALVILDYDGNYIGDVDVTNLGNIQKDYIRSILQEHYIQSILGDFNGDGTVNVQDLVLTVNLALSSGYNGAVDLNSDSVINVLDIVQIVNIILN